MSPPPVTDEQWQPRLAALVTALTEQGDLRSPSWIDAFAATPRHVFVPAIIETTDGGHGYRTLTAADGSAWWDAVYSDTSLVTQHLPHTAGYRLPSGDALAVPTSSSTMPSLMARMLEILDVRDGMGVLEIGTGTGYNAALLSRRVGASNVVSVDIDADLVDAARSRLADLGHHPTVIAGDGADGAPGHGSFDRIIATAAVADIPTAWLHQLAPGGKILANLRGETFGGALLLLTKDTDDLEAVGPILPLGGHFMWLRPDPASPHRPHEHRNHVVGNPARTTTTADPAAIPIDEDGFRFLLQLELPGAAMVWKAATHDPITRTDCEAVIVTAVDGSRAEAFTEPGPDGSYRLSQTGPRRLSPLLEATHRLWRDVGRPGPDRYGVVATDIRNFVWLDTDTGWYRWPLPLV